MSRASDLEAARLAKERTDARCDAIQIAVTSKDSHVVLVDFARQMLAEATYVAEQRKSGWKSRSDAHTAAGRILGQWAKDLAAYLERDKPPMRPPLETIAGPTMYEHLDPAGGPISAQITSGLLSQASEGPVTADVARAIREAKTVDDKLDVAFGPVSPRAELIERDDALESRANAGDPIASAVLLGRELERADPGWPDRLTGLEPVTHITAAPANYAWCDVTSGARGYVGSATCPDCIARYDAYDAAANKALALDPGWTGPPALLLEPFDDVTTRRPDGRMAGAAKFAINDRPTAVLAAQVIIHGFTFDIALPEGNWHSGILTVNYEIDPNGAHHVTDQAFEPDLTGPMTGVSAVYLWPDNGDEPIVMTAHANGPVVTIDWNAKGEATVSIPQFSEPGAPPPRQTQQRLSFAQVREHGQARARGADHRSYSQVQAFKECGIKYALSDLDTPAWWNVGGTALHYACEHINRDAVENAPASAWNLDVIWTNCLGRATSEAIAEHPTVDTAHWRAAKKGVEGYDWWRINGVDMVRRWVTRLTWLYDQGWRIAEFNGVPAIEYDCPMWIHTSVWPPENRVSVKVENKIDLAMTRDDGTLLIVDAKSGASAPDSTAQLGQYAHALGGALIANKMRKSSEVRILGAYWLARTDELRFSGETAQSPNTRTDLRELHPWDEFEYLITTMDAAESAGLYLPNKSKSDRFGCGSCGVAGLCPVGPS